MSHPPEQTAASGPHRVVSPAPHRAMAHPYAKAKAKAKGKAKAKAKAAPRGALPTLSDFSNCRIELLDETAFISAFPNAGRFTFAPFTARRPDCKAHVLDAERRAAPVDRTRRTAAYSICCDRGRVRLPPIEDSPEPLATLLREQSPRAAAFRNNIRAYDGSL